MLYFPVNRHRAMLRSWKLVLLGTEHHPHRPHSTTTSPSPSTTARTTLPPLPPSSRRGGRGGGSRKSSLFDLKNLPSNVVVMGPCPKPAGVIRLFHHRTLPPPPKSQGKNTVSLRHQQSFCRSLFFCRSCLSLLTFAYILCPIYLISVYVCMAALRSLLDSFIFMLRYRRDGILFNTLRDCSFVMLAH